MTIFNSYVKLPEGMSSNILGIIYNTYNYTYIHFGVLLRWLNGLRHQVAQQTWIGIYVRSTAENDGHKFSNRLFFWHQNHLSKSFSPYRIWVCRAYLSVRTEGRPMGKKIKRLNLEYAIQTII